MIVVKHIAVILWIVWSLEVYGYFSFRIDELQPSIIIDTSQTVGKYPRMGILRLDSYLTSQKAYITTFVSTLVASQRVPAQRLE